MNFRDFMEISFASGDEQRKRRRVEPSVRKPQNKLMTFQNMMDTNSSEMCEAGTEDARMGVFDPPKHYGTQMSAQIRYPYLMCYLNAGGEPSKLERRDWFHAGIAAVDLGMPEEIRRDVIKWHLKERENHPPQWDWPQSWPKEVPPEWEKYRD